MRHWKETSSSATEAPGDSPTSEGRLLTDGGRDQPDEDGTASDQDDEIRATSDRDSDGSEATNEPSDDTETVDDRDIDEAETTDDRSDEPGALGGEMTPDTDSSNVEVMDAGEAEPAEPTWEEPDIQNVQRPPESGGGDSDIPEVDIDDVDDIPEVTGPKTRPADWDETDGPTGGKSGGTAGGVSGDAPGGMSAEPVADDTAPSGGQTQDEDPTAGMPNTARSPGNTRLREGGADGYVVALELCAQLPDDIRLPDEAADLVPVALEAELEQNVQQFAGEQFENPSPHVETLDFVEVDGDIWFRLRLGIPHEAFADLDPDEIQEHALQKLEGML